MPMIQTLSVHGVFEPIFEEDQEGGGGGEGAAGRGGRVVRVVCGWAA